MWTLKPYSSRSSAARSRSETRRTESPRTRAASYIVGALPRPRPWSKSRRRRVVTDWASDRLPEPRTMRTRSPSLTNRCILRVTLTWSIPALVRESEAITSPWWVRMPRQYVMVATPLAAGRCVHGSRRQSRPPLCGGFEDTATQWRPTFLHVLYVLQLSPALSLSRQLLGLG